MHDGVLDSAERLKLIEFMGLLLFVNLALFVWILWRPKKRPGEGVQGVPEV